VIFHSYVKLPEGKSNPEALSGRVLIPVDFDLSRLSRPGIGPRDPRDFRVKPRDPNLAVLQFFFFVTLNPTQSKDD